MRNIKFLYRYRYIISREKKYWNFEEDSFKGMNERVCVCVCVCVCAAWWPGIRNACPSLDSSFFCCSMNPNSALFRLLLQNRKQVSTDDDDDDDDTIAG